MYIFTRDELLIGGFSKVTPPFLKLCQCRDLGMLLPLFLFPGRVPVTLHPILILARRFDWDQVSLS